MSGELIDLGDGRTIPMSPVARLKGRRLDQLEDAIGMTLAEINDVLQDVPSDNEEAAQKYLMGRPYRHAFGAVIWASLLAAGETTADYWEALDQVAVADTIQSTILLWAGDASEEEADPTQAGDSPAIDPEPDPGLSIDSASEIT